MEAKIGLAKIENPDKDYKEQEDRVFILRKAWIWMHRICKELELIKTENLTLSLGNSKLLLENEELKKEVKKLTDAINFTNEK